LTMDDTPALEEFPEDQAAEGHTVILPAGSMDANDAIENAADAAAEIEAETEGDHETPKQRTERTTQVQSRRQWKEVARA